MKRTTVAAVVALALLSTAGCGSVGSVGNVGTVSTVSTIGTDVSGPEASTSSPADPQPRSACLTTPSTGDSTVMVDWVDFVQLHGTQYLAGLDGKVPAVSSDQLGPAVGTVQCQLSVLKFQAAPGPAADGDAAFIVTGTEVHAIRGYQPSCRVAAHVAGVNRVYLAHADVGGASTAVPCAKAP